MPCPFLFEPAQNLACEIGHIIRVGLLLDGVDTLGCPVGLNTSQAVFPSGQVNSSVSFYRIFFLLFKRAMSFWAVFAAAVLEQIFVTNCPLALYKPLLVA
jgi:hypothetical protein